MSMSNVKRQPHLLFNWFKRLQLSMKKCIRFFPHIKKETWDFYNFVYFIEVLMQKLHAYRISDKFAKKKNTINWPVSFFK